MYMQTLLALVFVLGLIFLMAWVAKKFGINASPNMSIKNKMARLKVVDFLRIDARRSVVLIKRDNKEHLVLLGVNGDILLESGIDAPNFEGLINENVKEVKKADA